MTVLQVETNGDAEAAYTRAFNAYLIDYADWVSPLEFSVLTQHELGCPGVEIVARCTCESLTIDIDDGKGVLHVL